MWKRNKHKHEWETYSSKKVKTQHIGHYSYQDYDTIDTRVLQHCRDETCNHLRVITLDGEWTLEEVLGINEV